MQKPVLVIKLGTAVISDKNGLVSRAIIKKVAAEIAFLQKQYSIVLVSSGAVASGKKFIHDYKGTLTERKAAAAIGNPILIRLYQKYFDAHHITVAQALCERHHFSNRTQFLQLKETFVAFWSNGILPIVNENDLVSNHELKFSDNDELATLLSIGFDAYKLIICTSSGGLLDNEKKVIPMVQKIDNRIMQFVHSGKTSTGLGGMLSKLTFTRLANSLGIEVVICGLSGIHPLKDALNRKNGTQLLAQPSNLKARQKWLASGSVTLGSLLLDKGAIKAILQRKSLLTIGITTVKGKFESGEVVQLMDDDENIVGVAMVKINSKEILNNRESKNILAAHADNIVIF